MKKLIFVHLLNDYSGSPKVLSQVIQACEQQGMDIELFTGKSTKGFLTNSTKHHQFYFYKRFENKIGTLFSFITSQVHLFFKLLPYRNQDTSIYINTMLPFGAALFGKFFNKPVYYHIHETSISPAILKRFLRFMVQKTASKIVFVSNSVKNLESFKTIEQRVIYNALSEDFIQKAMKHRYQVKQDTGTFNVLMVCSLKAYKGVDEFMEIAKQCLSQDGISFTLVLNVNQQDIDSYFGARAIPNNVTIKAAQNDLHAFYQKASLTLNLSRIDQWVETFGLTIVEAMAYGVPVIVPPVGGPSELVTDGKEGYLMSSYETEAIANKIIELSTNETTCLALSKQALTRSKDFKEDTFNTNILNLLND